MWNSTQKYLSICFCVVVLYISAVESTPFFPAARAVVYGRKGITSTPFLPVARAAVYGRKWKLIQKYCASIKRDLLPISYVSMCSDFL